MKKTSSDLRWEWLGAAIPYASPRPGEDLKALGQAYMGWFPDARPAVRGDTYPMTWADDDEIYASSGDPNWGQKGDGLDVEVFSGMPPDYSICKVNEMMEYVGSGGAGAKPAGMICVKGALYLAVQNLLGKKPPAHGEKSQHGSDATIICSHDHGKSWSPARSAIKEPMFPSAAFGGPAFVNCGKDNAGAPDEFVYAVSADQWDNGCHLRLGRVLADRIMDREAWEWAAGMRDASSSDMRPIWTSDLGKAAPVFSLVRRLSLPDMVYITHLRRYLLLTWALHQDFSPDHGSELIIYEAPAPWGPFSLVHHEPVWETQDMNCYCPRIPLKWVKADKQGLAGWLQFSGSWRKNSPHYRSHIRPFRLMTRE